MPNRLNLDGSFFGVNVIEDPKAVHRNSHSASRLGRNLLLFLVSRSGSYFKHDSI